MTPTKRGIQGRTNFDIAAPLLPPLAGVVAPLNVCVGEVQGMKRYRHARPVIPPVPGIDRSRQPLALGRQKADIFPHGELDQASSDLEEAGERVAVC